MRRTLVALGLLASTAACTTTTVNRAALVPHMTPTMRSGEPMSAPAELALGLSSVTHLGNLASAEDDDAVEVPGTQLESALRIKLGRYMGLGLLYAEGFDATAKQGKPTQPRVDGGDVRGYGVTLHGMIPTGDPRWHVGLTFETLLWSIPYVEYATCVTNCGGGPWTSVERDRSTVGQAALGVVPTYHAGRLTVFGGVTIRNHPTIEQKGVETEDWFDDEGDDVESGPANFVLSAGVEGQLGGGVRGSLIVYAPLPGPPVEYPPGLAAMLTIPFSNDAPKLAPRAPTAPPAGPPGTY